MKCFECKDHSDLEDNPWKSLSYIIFVIQFMSMTLDLFMDTSVEPAWHYAITTIEFVVSTLLALYQLLRLGNLWPSCKRRYTCKPTLLLMTSLIMQLAMILVAGYSYNDNEDWAEWTLFGTSIAWGLVNPMTYDSVAAAKNQEEQEQQAKEEGTSIKKKKTSMTWMSACVSVFTRHFSRTPILFLVATLFAIAQAILGTYQGAVINELTKAVTKGIADEQDVERLGGTLIIVWFCASLSRFIFDTLSALMFSRLDNWLRSTVFDKAAQASADGADSSLSLADYQARYASDITGVVGLYGTLLRGVVVNVLLICTNFVFLVIVDWKIAAITLGFLAMGVTSGPTDLAGTAARNVQNDVTKGLDILQDSEPPQDRIERHQVEVLVPLKRDLFRRGFFSNMVDTFNNFFSSFLTAIVVINMSWQVFNGELDSSQFLGIFFVFKQLQKPATKLSGVIKKAVSKTANLERVNAVVFGDDDGNSKDDGTEGDGAEDGEGMEQSLSTAPVAESQIRQGVIMKKKDPNIEYLKTDDV